MLPPYCVSIPRTDVPMETIIGAQNRQLFNSAGQLDGGTGLSGGGVVGGIGGNSMLQGQGAGGGSINLGAGGVGPVGPGGVVLA